MVSDKEREVLERWSKRPKSPHSVAQRARIVLLSADGLSNVAVAERVGVNQATVVKWRKRFIEGGIDGLMKSLGMERLARSAMLTSKR